MAKIINWSFSVIKDFETCPKKYYEEKVIKRYPFVQNDAARYGDEVHKAIEKYIKDGKPLGEHKRFKKVVDTILAKPGEFLPEQKMALTPEKKPVSWFGKGVWVRGMSDLTVIRDKYTLVLDWKTGSAKYPDPGQLEVMALLTWRLYPEVDKIKAALVFLLHNKMFTEEFTREDEERLWAKWHKKVERLEKAHHAKSFPPKQNGLCRKWCPVEHCEFNGD